MGFGDLLQKAGGANKPSDNVNMELELSDELKSSTIMFKFIAFKPSERLDSRTVPRRMQIMLRFFSFPEI